MLTVDRIVDGIVVLEKEDMTHIQIDITLLPQGIKEGSVLDFDGTTYKINFEAENEARKRIIQKQRNIFRKRDK